MRSSTWALVMCVALGCQQVSGSSAPAPSVETKATAPDGMCGEHGVLEALCTKCNPALIAVFQAKGDYCSEHGFPESICPVCHPQRGGKPSRDVSSKAASGGEAPADGTKVRFKTKEIAARAGIETTKAIEKAGGGGILAPVRLTYDAAKQAHVNARAAGVVRNLLVDIGAQVKKGAQLATLESADVGADRSRLRAARARLEIAQKNFERETRSHAEGIGTAANVLTAENEVQAAHAEVQGLSSALSLIGTAEAVGGSYPLRSPIDGIITKRNTSIGKLVTVEETLFEVVDPSSLWAEIDIPETELSEIKINQRVTIRIDGTASREFQGNISYVSPEVDPHTRTVKARAKIENEDQALRANMFGEARIALGGRRANVSIPAAAVQRAKDVYLVFVRLKEDEFEARRVEIGAREGNSVAITRGIRPDDEVVTTGSFLLKTETLKDSIGAGCCEAD